MMKKAFIYIKIRFIKISKYRKRLSSNKFTKKMYKLQIHILNNYTQYKNSPQNKI